MCIGKAMIICKGQRYPDYVMDSNDHKPLVKKLKLTDERPAILRNFIRVELSPLNSLTSTRPADWDVHIDECGDLPAWFEDKKADWEYKCIKIMTEKIVPSWIKDGVSGSLDLRHTQVKTLGSLKSVEGSLCLWGTQIKTLGSLKDVGDSLYLQSTQIKTLGSLESVGDSLYLRDVQIKTLGFLKSVGGYLGLQNTQVRTLPKNLKVSGTIYEDF